MELNKRKKQLPKRPNSVFKSSLMESSLRTANKPINYNKMAKRMNDPNGFYNN